MSHNHYRRMMSDSVDELAELQKTMDDQAAADATQAQPGDIYLAIDADNAGRLVGRAVLADDTVALSDISGRIDHGQELILNWAQQVGGQRISAGGDEATVSVPANALDKIDILRKDYEHATGLTVTVGVGQSLSQAGKALMAGKVRGKNQVVQYDDSVEQDLMATGKNVEAGTGSEEENKIQESYLQKEDPTAHGGDDHSHDNCEYCKEFDAKNGGGDVTCDCPYCAEYDAAQQGDHSHDNCPYCAEFDANKGDAETCDCPYCQQYDAEQGSQDAPPDAGQLQPQPNTAQLADAQVAPPTSADPNAQINPQAQQDKIVPDGTVGAVGDETNPAYAQDQTGLAADGMIENTSHPQGYDENTPGDMGLAEDQTSEAQPDLGQVLQGGLDNHADQIAKQRVGDMVGQALEKIKSQKQILEKAKEQAPDLYLGVILMMKSMMEMAKMLGFGGGEQPQEGAPAQAAPQSAAPQEGAAPAPKGISQ